MIKLIDFLLGLVFISFILLNLIGFCVGLDVCLTNGRCISNGSFEECIKVETRLDIIMSPGIALGCYLVEPLD